ncbi:MAG TPA: DNA-directed RNA polymerase subunit alpha C-terminal domain-containing protein [Alphaproteobacteria bacterium]
MTNPRIDFLMTPLDETTLSNRSKNALRRNAGLKHVAHLLTYKSKRELKDIDNLGNVSVDEVIEFLTVNEFKLGELSECKELRSEEGDTLRMSLQVYFPSKAPANNTANGSDSSAPAENGNGAAESFAAATHGNGSSETITPPAHIAAEPDQLHTAIAAVLSPEDTLKLHNKQVHDGLKALVPSSMRDALKDEFLDAVLNEHRLQERLQSVLITELKARLNL